MGVSHLERQQRNLARYKFKFLSDISNIKIIARGRGVRIRNYLNRKYGQGRKHRWRKLKGTALIEYPDGRIVKAEIHFYEAHGIGRVRFKVVRDLE
jgi:hypothetical protein